MKISISRYELVPRSSGAAREGSLLRVETPDGVGYADLHPWKEFGDLHLSDELEALASGRPTRLGERSLEFARADLKFRSENRSAFAGLRIPASHFHLPGPLAAGPDILAALTEDGYRVVKIKCGRNVNAELQQFTHLAHDWPDELRIRLDFNASLSYEAVDAYLSKLPRKLSLLVEFIEDPCAFSVESWSELKTKHTLGLALDLEATNPLRIECAAANDVVSHFVIKPAIQRPAEILKIVNQVRSDSHSVRFVMTSYLDHPLGQVTAAWEAAKFLKSQPGRLSECGLLSHIVYEPNDFSEKIESEGPIFLPPEGTGFGFDDLLLRRNWQVLR